MKLKATFFIYISLFFLLFVSAQEKPLSLNRQSSFHLNAGTTFFGSNQMSGNLLFLNPEFKQPLTERLSIHAGVLFSTVQFFQDKSSNSINSYSSVSLYAAGSYKVNDTWTLYGGLMHAKPFAFSQSENLLNTSTVFFGGFDYKLNDSNSIGIMLMYSKDPYPLLLSPIHGNPARTNFQTYPGDFFPGW
jgi:hypothetical protein